MNAKDIIDLVLNRRGITQTTLAKVLEINPQTFSWYLSHDVLKSKHLFKILDKYNISIKLIDNLTGDEIKTARKPRGKRIKQKIKGVVYDTRKAYPVANDFFADGEHEYTNGIARELYRKPDNTFFFAIYSEQDKRATIVPNIPEETAKIFVETYGTDLHTDQISEKDINDKK